MTKSEEFSKNYAALKACEKAYKWIMIVNIGGAAFFPVMFIFLFIGAITGYYQAIIQILLSVLILPAAHAGLSFYSCYRHHNLYAVFAILCILTALFIPSETFIDDFIFLYMVISLPMDILSFLVNIKFLWLEQQPGYPDFNMLLESEREKIRKFDEENPFEKRYKEIVRNRSEAMDGIAATENDISQKSIEDNNYMDEI